MSELPAFDWLRYFHGLTGDQAHDLAAWLAAHDLDMGEFMEIVDRSYALAPDYWHGEPHHFIARVGARTAAAYGQRKRRFAALMTALEDALVSGAFLGEVARDELLPAAPSPVGRRGELELLSMLERMRRGEA